MKFEEIPQKVRDAADAVGKKTTELVEEGKLLFKIRDAEKDIENRLRDLGRQVYTMRGDADGVGDLMEEIDALHETVHALKHEYALVRGEKYCAACQSYNRKHSAFCDRCGKAL